MPLMALGALGVAMAAFVAAGPWVIRTHGYGVFVPCMLASGFITIAATMLARTVPVRLGLLVVLVFAAVMRLPIVAEAPFLSTDIYRYVWDGRVQGAGINPYLHVPADDALKGLRDTRIYPSINRADYALTAYPPIAQIFFLAVTRISETLTAMRLAMVGCEIVVIAVIVDLLRRLRLPAPTVVAWAWHPLAIWEIANNGHVDALMVALLMLSVWLLVQSRSLAAAAAIALAALVKPYAIVVSPAFWRPWDWRIPVVIAAVALLCYLPYLGAGASVLGFVASGYLSEEGLAGGDGLWLVMSMRAAVGDVAGLTTAYALAALAVMAWLGWRAASRTQTTARETISDIAVLLMAALFFLSPNYPWYLLAVVPFIALGGGVPAWTMTLAAILLYRPLMLPDNDLAWKTLANLPFVIATAAVLLHGRKRVEARKAFSSTR